jgi:hypothetical protein
MYPFIKYLDQTYSEDKTLFKRIISERANSTSRKSAEGIINAVKDPEYLWWPGFLKHLMTGKLMDIPAETFLSLINSLDEVDYNTEDEKNNYLDAEYPDLSAKLYKLNFNLPAFENDAKLELKIGPSSLNLDYVTAMVFGLKNDKFYFLDEGVEITVPNLKSLHEDGYKSLVVAVINSASEPPFDEKIKIELDVALKPAPLSFNRVKLEVKALTHYDFGIGSPIWYNYYQDQAIRGSMNNFTFIASWDGAPPDPNSTASHSKGRIEVQFDPERYPDVIIGYSINELLTYVSGTYEHTIIGTNIEISGNDSGSGLYSYTASLEDACKNISSLKYTYSDFNNEENSYSTDGSLNCTDWGLLNFVFFYVQEDR